MLLMRPRSLWLFSFEIAVRNAFRMGGREAICGLERVIDCLALRQPPFAEIAANLKRNGDRKDAHEIVRPPHASWHLLQES